VKELWVNQLRLRLMRKGSNPLSSAVATENYENLILSLTRATSGLLHHNRCKTGRERDRGGSEIERKKGNRAGRETQSSLCVVEYQRWTDTLRFNSHLLVMILSGADTELSVPVSLLHSSSSLTQSVSAIFTAKQEEKRNRKKHS